MMTDVHCSVGQFMTDHEVSNSHSEGCVLPLVVELLPLSVNGYMVKEWLECAMVILKGVCMLVLVNTTTTSSETQAIECEWL